MTMTSNQGKSERWWRDSRYVYFVLSTIWIIILGVQIAATWMAPEKRIWLPGQQFPDTLIQPVPERIAATVLASVFILVYVRMMYLIYYGQRTVLHGFTNRERWRIRAPLLLLAIVLAALPHESDFRRWSWTFVFVVIAWTLTSTPEKAIITVIVSTAMVFAITSVLYDVGESVGLGFPAIAFGFMVSGYVINRGVIEELMVERSRVRDQAVTEERFRLARDLHDTVGHSMTQITLKAELARRVLQDEPTRAAQELAQIEGLSRELSAQVRRSIAGRVVLSLHQEIDRARELLQSMEVTAIVSGEVGHIPEASSDILAWCLREGVLNVVKHSGATQCEITFGQIAEEDVLTIADNGHQSGNESGAGQGLTGMKQRVEEHGGKLDFQESAVGHVLTIRIPA